MQETEIINGKTFFSSKAAAEKLGVSTAYVARLCRQKKYPAKKIKGAWYIQLDAQKDEAQKSDTKKPTVAATKGTIKKTTTKTEKKSVKKTTKKKSATTSKTKAIARQKVATSRQPFTKVTSRVIATFPTKALAATTDRLPVAYVKVVPAIVGVVTLFVLFFAAAFPFMDASLAAKSRIHEPFVEMKIALLSSVHHVGVKTEELTEYTSLAASVGVSSFVTEIANAIDATYAKEIATRSAHSPLARTTAHTPKTEAVEVFTAKAAHVAAVTQDLFSFERMGEATTYMSAAASGFMAQATCALGATTCTTAPATEPATGVTVKDTVTGKAYCLQVKRGDTVLAPNTPGTCDVELSVVRTNK